MNQPKPRRASPAELRERIGTVQLWLLLDEVPYNQVVRQAVERWACSERMAKRYIRAAREAAEEDKQDARRTGLLRRRI